MRFVLSVCIGLGLMLATGGLLSFIFGGWLLKGSLDVHGLGPFNGVWSSAEYCFLGAVLCGVGVGLAGFGIALGKMLYKSPGA